MLVQILLLKGNSKYFVFEELLLHYLTGFLLSLIVSCWLLTPYHLLLSYRVLLCQVLASVHFGLCPFASIVVHVALKKPDI